jgi:hypothetical protein
MDINYKKYLKYKLKYLELKKQSGGGASMSSNSKVKQEVDNSKVKVQHNHIQFNHTRDDDIKLYGEIAISEIDNFYKPFDIKLGDTKPGRRSSFNDVTQMKNELISILNKIKIFNKNIVKIDDIITHITKCHKDAPETNWEKYTTQNKDVIYNVLNSDGNQKISDFNTLKAVINTYLYLLYHYKLGDYNNKQLQLA